MLTFNNIGFLGRLGNQMFQYAALKGIAVHKKYKYTLPQHNFSLLNCFKIPCTISNFNTPQNKNIWVNDKVGFDEDFFNNCPDDVDIAGFFQSKKYFQHIEQELREDFTFKNNIFLNNLKIKETIALHIRRTDYLTDNNFAKLQLNYYKDALTFFDKTLPVIIFSDDIKWCADQDFFKDIRFSFSTLNNAYSDLCIMSACEYHIIANSSFSWWGSWLAKSKKTIAPKQWFDGELEDWNTKELYLNNWIVV